MKFLSVLITVLALQAATLQQLSMDQLSQNATAIVRARVTGSYTTLTGATIYTHYKLQATETWKGFTPAEVMLPGGTSGNLKQSVPGVPQLQTNTEYVMFLWTSKSTGITHLLGLTQGIFNVTMQTDGTTVAARAQIGETMLDAQGSKVTDQAVSMNIRDMKTRVHSANPTGAQVR